MSLTPTLSKLSAVSIIAKSQDGAIIENVEVQIDDSFKPGDVCKAKLALMQKYPGAKIFHKPVN